MGAVRFRAAVELRRYWRGSVVLAVLAGIGGGFALATFAGARRTDSALGRFVGGAGLQADAIVELGSGHQLPRAIAKLPGITRTAIATFVFLRPQAPKSSRLSAPDSISSNIFDDPSRPFLDGAIVVAGRVPDVRAPDEVAIDEVAARTRGWHVGDRLRFGLPTPEEAFAEQGAVGSSSHDPIVELKVTGVVRFPQDLEPVGAGIEQAAYRPADDMWLTPAFLGAHPDSANYAVAVVWLANGPADLETFMQTVRDRTGGQLAVTSPTEGEDSEDVIADAARAIHVQANALRVAAALAIAAVLFAAGLALSRQIGGGVEGPTLRSLGMTDGQRVAVGTVRGSVVAIVGAALALLVAIALSSRFPVGFARRAEADPGVRLDLPVLAIGALVIVITLAAWSALAAWRLARSDSALHGSETAPGRVRASRLGRSIGNSAAPVTAVVGLGMALDSRRGRGAVPVRGAVATMTVVVAAVVGALVFATSLAHLVSTPALQGWRWDVMLMGSASHQNSVKLADDRSSAAVADAVLAPVGIEGHQIATLAFRSIVGGDFAQIVEGEKPAGPRDVALGAKTMRNLAVSIGDRVTAVYGDGSRRRTVVMVVVGRAVMPSALGYPGMALADGAVTTAAAFTKLGVRDDQNNVLAFGVARFSPRSDVAARAAAIRHFDTGQTTTESTRTVISEPPRSAEVENLRRVSGVPWIVVALLGAVAAATIAHLLLTTLHRRRRDLALLRTLGFRRRQVVSTVVWQASTVTVTAVVAGIPLGVITGRWAWSAVAQSLGVSASPVTPVVALLLMAASTVLLAIAITAGPAWIAAPTRPAVALRSE